MKIISFLFMLILVAIIVRHESIGTYNGVVSLTGKVLINSLFLFIFLFYTSAYLYFCNLVFKSGQKLRDVVSGLVIPLWIVSYDLNAISDDKLLMALLVIFWFVFMILGKNVYTFHFGNLLLKENNKNSSLPIKVPSRPMDLLKYHIIMVVFLWLPVLSIHK